MHCTFYLILFIFNLFYYIPPSLFPKHQQQDPFRVQSFRSLHDLLRVSLVMIVLVSPNQIESRRRGMFCWLPLARPLSQSQLVEGDCCVLPKSKAAESSKPYERVPAFQERARMSGASFLVIGAYLKPTAKNSKTCLHVL